MQNYKKYTNTVLQFSPKRSKTLDKQKREMHRTGQVTKENLITENRRPVRCGRWCFCDITREHPTEFSKLGRSLHVTEEAVSIDSNERPHLAIDAIIQSGTTEIPPLLSSWIARAFFIYIQNERRGERL